MNANQLETRIQSLHSAEREQRVRLLQEAILHFTGEMNGRGLLVSSMTVNGIGDLCREALVDLTSSLWDCSLRVDTSSPGATSTGLRAAFMQNLESTFTALEGIHRGSAERFAATLQNKTLIPQSQVKEEYERLLLKYETELDMYVSTKLAANSASRFDTVKQLILSRPLILVLTLAISAILVLAAFADAISSLARRIAGWVTGEG